MSDEPVVENAPQTTDETWQEVGQQFRTLGESLASAVRAAWQSTENRHRLQDMQTGLESMVRDVSHAIQESARSPEVHQVRSEAIKTARVMRDAGEQTVQEVRPHLMSALRQLNDELQKFIDRMEQEKPVSEAKPPKPPVVDSTP